LPPVCARSDRTRLEFCLARGAERRVGVSVRADRQDGLRHRAQGEDGSATGLINLARNIGGSSGIAIVTTLLARRTQFHQHRLVGDMTPFDSCWNNVAHALMPHSCVPCPDSSGRPD
jgi:hypothetical protein